jgi:AcrR family transcriptional regulator
MKKRLNPRKIAVQERSRATVDAILEAATHILSENDADELSTNRIAEKAGVSVGSLYQYFPGKDAIMSALTHRLIERKLSSIEDNLATLVGVGATPEKAIEVFVDFIVDMKIKNLKFERALTAYLIRNGDFALSTRLDEKVIEKITIILEPIRSAAKGFDPDWSVFLLFHAIRGIILATSIQRPQRLKDPAFKREMAKLVKSYLLK